MSQALIVLCETEFCRAIVTAISTGVSPLMELPPLSPGIQDRVMDVVVVLVTVRRGWSGGTTSSKLYCMFQVVIHCHYFFKQQEQQQQQ